MKRNLKGKLILSIATLGLAAASTIGSTYAWFIVSSDATAKGVEMKANAGTGLYIRNGHSGAFGEEAKIKSGTNLKWEPVTGYKESALTTASAFAGTFGTFSGIDSTDKSKLTYTAVNGATITNTNVFGKDDSTAYYYTIEMDYMISANKTLKINATDVTVDDSSATVDKDKASIAQAARVAFFPASGDWTDTSSSPTYSTDGVSEYCLTDQTTSADYNLEQLKALGYSGEKGDYKLTDRTNLTSTAYEISSHTNKTTNDGSFIYGSVKIFVWFDGTDYACSNALFEQKLTFNFTFSVKADTTTTH